MKMIPLCREFNGQKPTHMGGTYPYQQYVMYPGSKVPQYVSEEAQMGFECIPCLNLVLNLITISSYDAPNQTPCHVLAGRPLKD